MIFDYSVVDVIILLNETEVNYRLRLLSSDSSESIILGIVTGKILKILR